MNNSYFNRKYVILGIFIAIALIIVARLFYIQVIDDRYLLSANNNVMRKKIIYPSRGIILDRNGQVLVQNESVYDIMVTPREVKELDTLLLCDLLEIDTASFNTRMNKAKAHSPYRASQFMKQVSSNVYAKFQEHLYKFRGFYALNRTVRSYPDSIAAQFLGYIQEVNDRDIERSDGFYRPGDYIGATGVERSYEDLLRGKRGVENQMVDALNRPQGSFMDGKFDTLAVTGDGLVSSLDKDLQILAERLMKNKMGSVVAIEPSSGEILSFVSSPGYDPNTMVGRDLGNNYMKLLNDENRPMFIRPIQASYPPGSVFKVASALIAQQAGVIDENTVFHCPGGYRYGRGGRAIMRCTHVDGATRLVKSIRTSCNTYYGYVFARMIDSRGMSSTNAYDQWRAALGKLGLGRTLGIDLPGEKAGLVPTSDFYTKRYGSDKWRSGFNISLSIGQGELGITPLQMANIMAIVANRGHYYRPHLIKGIGDRQITKPEFTEKIFAGIDPKYYEPVIEGMSQAINQGGTGAASRIKGIEMCGKTGTVQNPHGENHAVFFAFAPREDPKIAIAVFVENAGYGGVWAAPIASMMVESYLKDTISLPQYIQDRIYNGNLLPEPKEEPEEVNQNDSTSGPKSKNQTAHNARRDPRRLVKSETLVHQSQIRGRHE
ncbi:MAG: penicillin-binding protein 2 [Sphingobacterium sp.]